MKPYNTSTQAPAAAATKMHGLRAHIIALVVAALIPAFAVGAIAVWAGASSYRQAFDDRLEGTAKALASAIEAEVTSHTLALATLATARSLDGEGDLVAFHGRARQLATMLNTRIVLVAPDLSLLLHTHFPITDGIPDWRPRESADVVRRVLDTGHPAVGGLVKGQVTGRWVAPVYVPVVRQERIVFAIGAALEADRISRMLSGQAFRGNGYASLVDGTGRIMARSAEAGSFVGQTVRGWVTEGVNRGESGILRGPNRSGVEVVTAFRRVPGTPGWFVTVAEPLSTYHASLLNPLATLAFGALGALAIALAVAIWIARRVLRPVDWLTQKAERVAASGGAAEIVPQGPRVRVLEFERLHAAVLHAHMALRERARAVAAGEARLRAVLDTAADAIVVTDEGGAVLSFNRAAEVTFGYAASEVIGHSMAELVETGHGTCFATFSRNLEQNVNGAVREVEGRRKDGSTVPLDLSIAEWRDAEDRSFFTVIMRDVSARKAAEARQHLLMREVDHRSKNVLAVVQSVLRLTPRNRPGAFAAAEARIAGLARVHSLLAEGGWSGTDLRVVVERELAAYCSPGIGEVRSTVFLDGPPITLATSAVQPLAMVLHELATNAAKYGALSVPGGRVEVGWQAGGREGEDGLLRLRWTESGGPAVAGTPGHRGFGTRVVESTVRGQLGGSVVRRWEPDGLVFETVVPLARVLAGDEAAASGGADPTAQTKAA